jgi:hypothetical protein
VLRTFAWEPPSCTTTLASARVDEEVQNLIKDTEGSAYVLVRAAFTRVRRNLPQMISYVLLRGMAGGCGGGTLQRARAGPRAKRPMARFSYVQGVCPSPYFDRPGTASERQAFFLFMEAAADDFSRA